MIRNFSWIIKDELAGMARPYSFINDFEFLKDEGVDAIISLTESPLEISFIEEFGFDYLHLPIADFSIPTFEQIKEFIAFTSKLKNEDKNVVLHCESGIGRTGTMSAIYLVNKGFTAHEAILKIREVRPGSIETKEQEDLVYEYGNIVLDIKD